LRRAGFVRRRAWDGAAASSAGFVFSGILFLVLERKLQLIEVNLLGTRTKPMTQHPLDQLPHLLVLGQQFRHHFPQNLLQNRGIVREFIEINLHARMMPPERDSLTNESRVMTLESLSLPVQAVNCVPSRATRSLRAAWLIARLTA
jgi:hypothetical protein